MIAVHRTTLRDLPDVLPAVLRELRVMDVRRRPFVIVDEPLSKHFVQFGRIVDPRPPPGIAPFGEMAFDVPALGIYRRVRQRPGRGRAPRGGRAAPVAA